MPYKSEKQRKFFHANKEKLEAQGVDVAEWDQASKGKKLPKEASVLAAVLYLNTIKRAAAPDVVKTLTEADKNYVMGVSGTKQQPSPSKKTPQPPYSQRVTDVPTRAER